MRVTVIGAGLSGLAAACYLLADGHDVTVLEREDEVGGRAGRWRSEGFTFDTGPVVMTMPELLHAPLRAVGADPAALVPMERLDPAYRAVYADGSELAIRADMGDLRAEIARGFGADNARGFDDFVAWLTRLHEVEFDTFIDANLDSVLDLLRSPRRALELVRLRGLAALGPTVDSFFTDERLTRIFSFQALYAGIAPAKARALLAVITYMDTVRGVFYPTGGMHAVPRALARAATDAGAALHTGVTVAQILRRGDGAVVGVRTSDGTEHAADAVVSTLDLPLTYRDLLPGVDAPGTARRGAYSPSAVVWHVGARGRPSERVRHHNIHFGTQWDESFTALIDHGALMSDPSRLVTVPSHTDPDAAPDGHTAMYVLEPVPHLGAGLDWSVQAEPMRERLLAFLHREGYPTDIVTERLVTPQDWADSGLHLGTPFALAHSFTQSGPFRPGNTDRRVPGLVLAGSGTQPGVGIPMVLVSGRLAAERVAQYAPRSSSSARRPGRHLRRTTASVRRAS